MLKGLIPGPEQLTKRAVMMALTVPEGAIMLAIAVALDAINIFLFFLSLIGVGIPITFLVNIMGVVSIGSWIVVRPLFRGAISRATEEITKKVLNIGGGLEGIKNFQGTLMPGLGAGKKIAKTGVKMSISIARFVLSFLIKIIPFLGNIYPGWTILVIFELIQGEI